MPSYKTMIHSILLWIWHYNAEALLQSQCNLDVFPCVYPCVRSGKSARTVCRSSNNEDDEDLDEDFEIDVDQESCGKAIFEDDSEVLLSPLPQYLSESDIPFQPTSPLSQADETQRRIDEQQKQIDMLLKAMNNGIPNVQQRATFAENPSQSLANSGEAPSSSVSVVPLRVMVFIDGTWLYYSIHERRANVCPIIAKYGRGWQQYYAFNWNELPRVICEVLQEQESKSGWLNSDGRPVEVSRVNVFTSVKKNTSKHSNRLKMFDEMKDANYDVYMMETVGQGEKCIDIQLAVEMLHYATVPNAYDVAILLSGDKDFMPALIRTRQKARKVGIVSMKTYCNRALYETHNIADYDIIWLEDYLDRLFLPKEVVRKESNISTFTLMKMVYDFIDKSGLPMVSSRDVGRYLKQFKLGDTDLQTEIKYNHRGLHLFTREANIFTITLRSPHSSRIREKADPNDKSFWIGLTSNAESLLLAETKTTRFSQIEKDFFDSYSLALLDNFEEAYQWSILQLSDVETSESCGSSNSGSKLIPTPSLKTDYSTFKVSELKEICRERGLLLSGTKSVLIARIEGNDEERMMTATQNILKNSRPQLDHKANCPTTQYLLSVVNEYIQASGGTASSRDLGRYLTANTSYAARQKGGIGVVALTELKEMYGSLAKFVKSFPESFERSEAVRADDGGWEFMVSAKK